MRAKYWIPILLVMLIGLSGCAAKTANSVAPYEPDSFTGAAPYYEEAPAIARDTFGETAGTDAQRVVIKNASMSIVVDDPIRVLGQIEDLAENSGGFIVYSNLYKVTSPQGLEVPGADITVRVPAEKLEEVMAQIEAMLTDPEKDIQYENISGQDVTAEYTDLQSRLRNLEDAQEQLQAIMDDASRTEDVLAVFEQLKNVNEQIEVLRGQIKYYDESARLSSLQVKILAREGLQEISIGSWEPKGVALDAIQALVDTLKFLADAAIWIALYILPVAICILVPIVLAILVIRSIIRRRKQAKISAPPADQTPPAA